MTLLYKVFKYFLENYLVPLVEDLVVGGWFFTIKLIVLGAQYYKSHT